jgi:hypothetical protein
MGGNLFKIDRISKQEYFNIVDSLRPVLNKHFGDNYRIPTAYRNKMDYGDVDIIVDAGILINNNTWRKEICADLGVTQTQLGRNVFSMLYQNFQVDIFLVGTNKLETCNNFMSYNILGNLIGRIYHKFNLRYGEDGLFYVLRGYNNHISKEIIVSREMKDILEFVGLSYERWVLGFDKVEDIFEYVISSKYFCSNSYDLKYFNVQKRANERPDFNKFLDYISERNIEKNYPFNKEKEVYLPMIDEYFWTDLQSKYKEHVKKQEKLQIVSQKFNGKIVMELIPYLKDKELGNFITTYKESLGSNYVDEVLKMTQEEVNKNILNHYKYYGKENF